MQKVQISSFEGSSFNVRFCHVSVGYRSATLPYLPARCCGDCLASVLTTSNELTLVGEWFSRFAVARLTATLGGSHPIKQA
jgi:hypothetical protein